MRAQTNGCHVRGLGKGDGSMKATLRRRTSLLVALVACVLALAVAVAPAQAKDLSVTGADFYLTASDGTSQDDPNAVTLLTATGDEGAKVYVNVTDAAGKAVVSHLPLQLTGSDAAVYKLSVSFPKGYDGGTYTVEAYADRAEAQQLFRGTCTPVYAKLDGVDDPVLIGAYTVGEGETRDFAAPSSLTYQNTSYNLTGTETANASYTYGLPSDAADSVDVTVTYVKADGSTIKTETLGSLKKGESGNFGLSSIFTVGEGDQATSWLPVSLNRTLQASYAGTHDFVITCEPAGTAQTPNSYVAQISLQGTDGQALGGDRIGVYGTYTYTLPTTVYQTVDGELVTYTLKGLAEEDKADKLNVSTGVLSLDSSRDGLSNTQDFTALYQPQADDADLTFTLKCVCYDPDNLDASGKPVTYTESHTTTVKAENTQDSPATIGVPAKVTWNNKTFVPANMPTGGSVSYAYGSGEYPVTTVYYVPEGYKPADSYQVKVEYRNIADRSVVRTDTVDVTPDMKEDLTITPASQFSVSGETYVLLKGTPTSISHGYYTPYRTYTIWCRNVKDTIYETAQVVTSRVEYYDGGTVVVPGATTTNNGTNGANGANDANGAPASTAAIPNQGDVTTVVSPDGTATTVNNEGQDLNSERITDEATPLASGASDQEGSDSGVSPVALGVGVALAAAVAVAIVVLYRRKKQEADKQA